MKIIQKTIIDRLRSPRPLSLKKYLIKVGCRLLFTSLIFATEVHSSSRDIPEDALFDTIHPGLRRYVSPKSDAIAVLPEDIERLERQEAGKAICGVVEMYSQDVNFGKKITYSFQLGNYVQDVNASYTYATRTFYLPRVPISGRRIILTACDQGIVTHEAGHMVLDDLGLLGNTSHTGAFHEAFGDLTTHFYRFYNEDTRRQSIQMLENGEGCVGDSGLTCVRDNSRSLTLRHIDQDERLCEVHELSKPFSSAVFDNMVTSYANRGRLTWAETAAESIITWHRRTLVRAVLSLNNFNPTLMDIAQKMLEVSLSDTQYREGLGQSFIRNNLIVLMYKSLPTPRYPNPPIVYSPNKEFAMLCLVQKKKMKQVFAAR